MCIFGSSASPLEVLAMGVQILSWQQCSGWVHAVRGCGWEYLEWGWLLLLWQGTCMVYAFFSDSFTKKYWCGSPVLLNLKHGPICSTPRHTPVFTLLSLSDSAVQVWVFGSPQVAVTAHTKQRKYLWKLLMWMSTNYLFSSVSSWLCL